MDVVFIDDRNWAVGRFVGEITEHENEEGELISAVEVKIDRPTSLCFSMVQTFTKDEIKRYGDERFSEGLKTASENVARIKELATELESGTRLGQDTIAE